MAILVNRGIKQNTTNRTITAKGVDVSTLAVKDRENGRLVQVCTASPLDREATVTTILSTVADVYKNTSIDPAVKLVSHKGLKAVRTAHEIWSLTDSDTGKQYFAPVSMSVTLSIPIGVGLEEASVTAAVQQFIADGVWDASTTLVEQLHGVLDAIASGTTFPKAE